MLVQLFCSNKTKNKKDYLLGIRGSGKIEVLKVDNNKEMLLMMEKTKRRTVNILGLLMNKKLQFHPLGKLI